MPVLLKIAVEQGGQLTRRNIVGVLIRPRLPGHQDLVRNTRYALGNGHPEYRVLQGLYIIKLTRMDSIDDGTSMRETHPVAGAVGSAGHPGIYQPRLGAVLFHLCSQHFGIARRVQYQEGVSEAGRKRCLRLINAHLRTGDFGRVS